jgi:thiol-disulfide isomerase/thioredoxin
MAVYSQMLDLGTSAPPFRLPDPDGNLHSLEDAADSKACVVMFICNHCPFVKHIADELARLGRDYEDKGVAIFAINSNNAETHPGDSPDNMARESVARGYSFPYLIDESQVIARAYKAACTPDIYLFDAGSRLAYHGQFDSSRPGNSEPVDGVDLRRAIDAVLGGAAVAGEQIPSVGCGIKWR